MRTAAELAALTTVRNALKNLQAGIAPAQQQSQAADRFQQQADQTRTAASQGLSTAFAAFDRIISGQQIGGGVPLVHTAASDQMVLVFGDGTAYVYQDENGEMVEHPLGLADDTGNRVCDACGRSIFLPATPVAVTPPAGETPPML